MFINYTSNEFWNTTNRYKVRNWKTSFSWHWLIEKLFNSLTLYLLVVFQNPFEVKLHIPSSWCATNQMINNEECLKEHAKWPRSVINFVYGDEVEFNLHLTRWFGKACQRQKRQQICPIQRGWNIYLWQLQFVVKESLHTMSHLVPRIQTNS